MPGLGYVLGLENVADRWEIRCRLAHAVEPD